MLALIRGAGDIASGAAMRLWRCGIDVVMTDLARPTAIRRTVAFSDAIVHGETTVEGLRAVRAENAAEAKKLLREGSLPVLADPECACREELAPDALVDAILAKRNLGTKIDDAPIVVGVGPGFTAGEDCHAVVETMRGHTLGRVIYSGSALPNTNIPGLIGGFAGERADHVVGFVAGDLEAGNAHRFEDAFDVRNGRHDVFRRFVSVSLVLRIEFVAEGSSLGVEGDAHVTRRLLHQDVPQKLGEAEYRRGVDALPVAHGSPHEGVIRPVYQGVCVE